MIEERKQYRFVSRFFNYQMAIFLTVENKDPMGYEKKVSGTYQKVVVTLSENNDKSQPTPITKPPSIWFSKRFLLTVLLFFGCVNMHSLKSNLSIALVEMTSKKNITRGNETVIIPPEYSWDSNTIALIISMFSYGYLFCAVGGHLATKFGGSVVYGTGMLLSGLVTMLQPISLYTHFYLFLVARVLAGFTESIAYASTVEVLARWIPLNERSRLMSYSFSGIYVGSAITYPFCGFIAHKWGWPWVFYSTGMICFTSAVLWLLFIKNDPSKDKWISKKELIYILQGTENTPRKQIVHPYKKILTSMPFWALCFSKFTYSWGYTLLITCFPLYVKDMTNRSIDQIGLISAIPNVICIFVVPITGTLMDYCQNKTNLQIHLVHKILMCVGLLAGSGLILIPAFVKNFTLSMICFVLVKIVLAFNFLIAQLACIYMAPKHSSVLAGLAAIWHILSSILSPTMVGLIVVNHKWEEWSKIFCLASGVMMAGAIIFFLFGSTELQPWASSEPIQEEDEVADENKQSIKQ